MSHFDALVAKLREIFQIDRPDLDFGVYRILNARAGEIEEYLSKRLKARVTEVLAAGAAANTETLKADLAKAAKAAEEAGISADDAPKVQQLRAQLAAASQGASEHENQVFSHLLTFFGRYFDKGDFISQRRYKGDTYAIPYSGEEVVLHWANRDQYYTKSGEAFSNFSFRLEDGRAVHFRLVAADTAKDNRKDNDKERRFVLATARTLTRRDEDGETYEDHIQPVAEEDGALVIRFDYAPQPKGTRQEALVEQAVAAILADAAVKARWLALTDRAPTEKNPQRTLLEKHLTKYTQKHTADYFIHKDLGGFLRRELDFYIKNEVMNLDDVQGAGAFADIEKNLRMIQCLRAIALDLITFLASIENFQKKLWLKKKFVVAAHYCVTLDRVPEVLYPAIAMNGAQWGQWRDLGMWSSPMSGTVADLKAMRFLMVDTALFDAGFRAELLNAIPDLDASLDGLLVHGDNFQALTMLEERFRDRIKCVYMDPPYNIGKKDFTYKDTYKHSSWAAMLFDRLKLARRLLRRDGLLSMYIDENEHYHAALVISSVFSKENRVGDIIWRNSSKNDQSYVSMQHEYLMTTVVDKAANKGNWNEKKEGLEEIYSAFNRFRKEHGDDWNAIHAAALKWYGTFPDSNPIRDSKHYSWMDERGVYFPSDISGPNFGQYRYDVPHPGTGRACREPASGWRYPEETMKHRIKEGLVHFGDDETTIPNNKTYLNDTEYQSLTSVKYRDGRVASKILSNLFDMKAFTNPKDHELSARFLKSFETGGEIILDHFAGTGTTGHAILHLKRLYSEKRCYILVEQGEYFDVVLKPRMMKIVYSADWSEGKPTAPETGISHAFKVLKIESYEDTLNNLDLQRSEAQANLLNGFSEAARDDYLMRYMLDVEAQGSLLSVADFRKPFDYTLKIAVDSAGAWEKRKVDLVETFNYLIGLTVREYESDIPRGYVRVTGTLPDGRSALVIWRDCDVIGYQRLQQLIPRFDLNIAEKNSPYDVIYINGDHNIPVFHTTSEAEGEITRTLKLRQIEPVFLDAMFNVDDV